MQRITTEGVVAWSDTDASGRIHFTAPWRWVENAEHELYRRIGPDGFESLPRRATAAAYEQALTAGDPIRVELAVDRVGTTSVTYSWEVHGPAGVAVTGSYTVVHVDGSGRPTPLSPGFAAALAGS